MIVVEIKDGWRKLVLNRPEKLNAVSPAMLTELLQAIGDAEADGATRALLLTGNGRGFCAGQELGSDVTPGANGPP
ncbi:MAG TPA: enoyl-CoA hydratase-related protein, partial [Acetobacteraceae bacterium]|nr:enoyl-CoA hydratase-related protein [Acetobacteraceae bacterium]